MKPKNISVSLILIVAILALGIWLGKNGHKFLSGGSQYAAVYMQTGDIYYGKLHSWPRLYLENVWYFQVDEEGQAQLVPYKGLTWGPSDKMYLNRDQIVWWTPLRSDSQLIAAFEQAAQTTN